MSLWLVIDSRARMSRGKESLKIFRLLRNVIDNKGPKMRKVRQMRIPRNVYENKST